MSTIHLLPELFAPQRRLVAEHGAITAHAFRYDSGVPALEVSTRTGRVIWLPFQGQQIWDAAFHGRRLTMDSPFDQPLPTRDYLATYGAFLIHCGGTSMGNPGPEDNHPLHGELPNLTYDRASLVLGQDEQGAWIDLTGTARDTRAFHHDFTVTPRIRLREDGAEITSEIVVGNTGRLPFPFLYLLHANFRPVDGGQLIDTLRDDERGLNLRVPVLPPDAPPEVRAYHEGLAAAPSKHRRLLAGAPILPEMVATMSLRAGEDGWTHALHLHPDGQGDAISYRPGELPVAVRWITRGGDLDALGLVLPATAAPDGLAAANRKGQVIRLAPGGSFQAETRICALLPDAAKALADRIAAIREDSANGK